MPDDYVNAIPELPRVRRYLTAKAVPSVFAWNTVRYLRTSNTSKKAAQSFDVEPGKCIDNLASVGSVSDSEEVEYGNDDFVGSGVKDPESEIQSLNLLVAKLKLQVSQLQDELKEARNLAARSLFRLENIKDKTELVKYYTGFPDYVTLLTFYEQVLEADAKVMKLWDSRRCGDSEATDVKCGPSCKLPLLEQFFLTLVRLRLGLFETDLAVRFGLSQSSISRITTTWINLMFHSLKALYRFPPWHIVKKYMPETFRKQYPNTRIIIDATEFAVERPSSLVTQSSTFSTYKNRNTVKVLVGIMPSGPVTFVSDCYEGSISDKKLVQVSGLLDKLEPGDEVMADKGFLIQDILAPLGVRLNVPPLMKANTQMAADDVILTKKIAQLRIHVERAIGRIKEYHILQGVLPAAMWDTINQVVFVCCMLSNFNPPLVSSGDINLV